MVFAGALRGDFAQFLQLVHQFLHPFAGLAGLRLARPLGARHGKEERLVFVAGHFLGKLRSVDQAPGVVDLDQGPDGDWLGLALGLDHRHHVFINRQIGRRVFGARRHHARLITAERNPFGFGVDGFLLAGELGEGDCRRFHLLRQQFGLGGANAQGLQFLGREQQPFEPRRSLSRRAATSSEVTSSAEIRFQASILPSSFTSIPHRVPPVFSQRA